MNVPLLADVDVLVVGAGSAGCTAAIAAASTGARTLLIERYGFAGGTSTGVLDTFYGFCTPGVIKKVVGGIPDTVVKALEDRHVAFRRPNTFGAGTGVTYDPETLKVVWEELILAAGAAILFHLFAVDVSLDSTGRGVVEVLVSSKAGLGRIRARQVVDASGDADIVARAGGSL